VGVHQSEDEVDIVPLWFEICCIAVLILIVTALAVFFVLWLTQRDKT